MHNSTYDFNFKLHHAYSWEGHYWRLIIVQQRANNIIFNCNTTGSISNILKQLEYASNVIKSLQPIYETLNVVKLSSNNMTSCLL